MKVLITGADGFIGRNVAASLALASKQIGHCISLYGSVRREQGSQQLAVERVITTGDLSQPFDWRDALQGCSQVIHTAGAAHNKAADMWIQPTNCQATVNLAAQAAQAGVKRFIFFSSIAVYGKQASKAPLTEQSPPQPNGAYGESKWAAEQALAQIACESAMEIVIIRPALTYGWDAPANINKLLRFSASGWPAPFARVTNRRHFLAIENLCSFMNKLVLNIGLPNLAECSDLDHGVLITVNLADTGALSLADVVRHMRKGMQQRSRLWPIPVSLMQGGVRLCREQNLADQLFSDLLVSNAKATQVFDWTPAVSSAEAMRNAAAEYQLKVVKQTW